MFAAAALGMLATPPDKSLLASPREVLILLCARKLVILALCSELDIVAYPEGAKTDIGVPCRKLALFRWLFP